MDNSQNDSSDDDADLVDSGQVVHPSFLSLNIDDYQNVANVLFYDDSDDEDHVFFGFVGADYTQPAQNWQRHSRAVDNSVAFRKMVDIRVNVTIISGKILCYRCPSKHQVNQIHFRIITFALWD